MQNVTFAYVSNYNHTCLNKNQPQNKRTRPYNPPATVAPPSLHCDPTSSVTHTSLDTLDNNLYVTQLHTTLPIYYGPIITLQSTKTLVLFEKVS